MTNQFVPGFAKPWSRRQLLKFGLAGAGLTSAAIAFQTLKPQRQASVKVPPIESDPAADPTGTNPMAVLRNFDYGTLKRENGRNIREFQFIAGNSTLQLNSASTLR